MFRTVRGLILFPVLAGLPLTATPVQAQLGGLIKKATQKAAASVPAGEPDAYTDILLELKADVLPRVIAGKKAGNAFAAGPSGPHAARTRHEAAAGRANDFRQRNAGLLEAWEERLSRSRNCTDSAYVALDEQRRNQLNQRMMGDPVLRQKMIEAAPRIAAAQQKAAQGDSADLNRINAELQALGKPTAADSAQVRSKCGLPPAPPAVQQLATLEQEAEKLRNDIGRAEAEAQRLEEQASGLNQKQLAVACERILIYLNRLKAQGAQKGFSAAELEALDRHRKDLEKLCG